MCDEKTLNDSLAVARKKNNISRRRFGQLSAVAGLGAMLPRVVTAQDLRESDVLIDTPDGVADAYFVYPGSGQHPAVLIWPDIFGLRATFRAMARRLAESGYAVLVVNPFYRTEKAPVVQENASFQDPGVRDKLFGLMNGLTEEGQMSDARAFANWLDEQQSVDTSRKMGTMGYCMGGPIIMRTAAALPERIGAAASFHGAGLATDAADSPHRLIPDMNAELLIAIAENDDESTPEAKHILRETFEEAGVNAEIEVYPALHGWCVPGSAAYDEEEAERAWARLMVLFDSNLA